ncbi:hypothetical protein [Acinetobacter populi]|uniref:Lipoprotein n=1 Tax=Acinetobacter populi TaxID=1582270 RepID=A0A1Z9YYX5_9GAMM|nr:hypothetical protein [Acinetobacter populi]OUY07434.1 hypothetical protein CAP51_06670 [Acinetobacter populi]
MKSTVQSTTYLVFSSVLLMACNQNNQPAQQRKTDQAITVPASTSTNSQPSKYAPYTTDEVYSKVNRLQYIVEHEAEFHPAVVKEAQFYLEIWELDSASLQAMMEADLDPDNSEFNNDDAVEPEPQSFNVRARIYGRESQSAFNVPGAIEYMLEIQSTDDRDFVLQDLKINRGHCGFYTGDFKSKLPVTMRYSATVSYLLRCRGDQVIDIELITDQGDFSLDISSN